MNHPVVNPCPPIIAGSPLAPVLLRAWERPISFSGDGTAEHWLLGIEAAARIAAQHYPGERIGAIVAHQADEVILQKLLDDDGRFFPVMTSPTADKQTGRPEPPRADGRIPIRVLSADGDAVRRMRRMMPILVVEPEALELIPPPEFARFLPGGPHPGRCIKTDRVIIVGPAKERVGWEADDLVQAKILQIGPPPVELVLAAG